MIAFLIIKTIILLGLAGYQIIITILALRTLLLGHLSYPARLRCTQICVYPRAFMTLRVAQFSLKIAHLSFSMGPRGTRAYGLRPRLWLLVLCIVGFAKAYCRETILRIHLGLGSCLRTFQHTWQRMTPSSTLYYNFLLSLRDQLQRRLFLAIKVYCTQRRQRETTSVKN